ncbi:Undecaprenyl-phosphate 4-deoxy-4-formamido-L-arabinose transferase [bacterium HR11]|nr:Undecaprenyl-phosphate 4-deoxy-4-formamido-L-arabinose transferase [bacterium HR11]
MWISVVIPAFNEVARLGDTLEQIRDCLLPAGASFEVVVVDDGSQDGTWGLLQTYRARYEWIRCVRLPRNHGKGRAVREGVAQAQGDVIVVYDADAATPPTVILEYVPWITEKGYDVVIGSRELGRRQGRRVTYPYIRRQAGRVFTWLARTVVPGFLDTQCGFKLFRREAAHHLFGLLEQQGYAWDVEILALARGFSYRVVEVPVDWHHRPGSKVHLVRDAWRMVWQLYRIRRRLRRILPDAARRTD